MKKINIMFKKVYFFEILCEFPWKSGMLLTIFFILQQFGMFVTQFL